MVRPAFARCLPRPSSGMATLVSRNFSSKSPPIETITATQRGNLGCPDYTDEMAKTWAESKIDLDGDKLNIQGHPVMESWEDGYMCRLAEIATFQGGKVLELGFGMAISANYIQKNKNSVKHAVEEHWVVEANHQQQDRAEEWAAPRRPLKFMSAAGSHGTLRPRSPMDILMAFFTIPIR